MSEINEKELEHVSGGRKTTQRNCPNFTVKTDKLPPGSEVIAGFLTKGCVNCIHFTGDSLTICELNNNEGE